MARIYKRGNIFWISFYFNKKEHCKILKTKDLNKAKELKIIYEGKVKTAKIMNSINNQMNYLNSLLRDPVVKKDWIARRWNEFNFRERQAVLFYLFSGKCQYCGRDVTIPSSRKYANLKNRAVIDHKIALMTGGSNNLENMTLSCQECNLNKSTKSSEEYSKELLVNKIDDFDIKD